MFDAFGFGEAEMVDLIEQIRRRPPQIIEAYASVLSHLAAFSDGRHAVDLPSPDGIITSTDMLFPYQRTLVERVFHSEVFNRYGSREVAVIAAECGEHRGLHISAENVIVEVIDDEGRPLPPGRTGRIVITDLWNYAMPFIRYDIEDMGTLAEEGCRCGRGLPLIGEISGRYADVLRAPDGRYVSASALTTVLHRIPGLQQAQIVQHAIDSLQVNVVRSEAYLAGGEQVFRGCLAEFFGDRTRISFHYVDDIPKMPSGKTRFSISRIRDGL
jgi:phenylacetate-CoA ligase